MTTIFPGGIPRYATAYTQSPLYYLIRIAEELNRKKLKKGFSMAARIIGEAIGQIEEYVGDSFLEYRLRHLIAEGVFEVQGSTKAMRYYSVKLR
ncbi:DUF3658 domain-containing protein [Neobacillus piezotolerans]|nr:DUF3658 domain-containing protein [Neobacillus piezotolerans]